MSAKTGAGLDVLVDHLASRMPDGPPLFPEDTVRDVPDEQWVAELVREQLLAVRVTSCRTRSPPRLGVGGLTDHRRDHRGAGEPEGHGDRQGWPGPQAGRRGGATAAAGVKVDKDWQRRPDRVERLY